MEQFCLSKSKRKTKKWQVVVYKNGKKFKTIYFGAKGYGDFIYYSKNIDADKKKRNYINRHAYLDENWDYNGRFTAGFWAKHLLWNKPTLEASLKYIREHFKLNITLH